MNLETLYHHDLKEKKETDFSFSIEERKWAAEAVADCYKRIENGTAKKLKAVMAGKNMIVAFAIVGSFKGFDIIREV